MKNQIYLDNAATTPVDREVILEMLPYLNKKYGNASTLYNLGREAREAVENTRKRIADFINVESEEIIFTSGGTESNNLAIKQNWKHIVTSKIEHPSVLETCKEAEKCGVKVDYISVNNEGIINLNELKNKITENCLVTIMHVNNEVGTIQPIEKIAEICKDKKAIFHTDAVQSFGKLKIDASSFGMLSASGHKINCVKGIGFLYVKRGIKLKPLLYGGGHERGLRSGTENVAGIVALGKAVELAGKKMKNSGKIGKLREKLIIELLRIKGTRLNGSRNERIFTNVNLSFRDVEGEALVLLLDKEGIATSTGSACSSHSLEPSHVLRAIGLSDEEAHGSLRLSLGWQNTEREVNYTIKKIKLCVEKLRGITGK